METGVKIKYRRKAFCSFLFSVLLCCTIYGEKCKRKQYIQDIICCRCWSFFFYIPIVFFFFTFLHLFDLLNIFNNPINRIHSSCMWCHFLLSCLFICCLFVLFFYLSFCEHVCVSFLPFLVCLLMWTKVIVIVVCQFLSC